jgi:hypothetical protein
MRIGTEDSFGSKRSGERSIRPSVPLWSTSAKSMLSLWLPFWPKNAARYEQKQDVGPVAAV